MLERAFAMRMCQRNLSKRVRHMISQMIIKNYTQGVTKELLFADMYVKLELYQTSEFQRF